MAKKCDKCLKGSKASITGVAPNNTTLKLDMGGAVLYVMPRGKTIDVVLNSESIIDGDYKACIWNGEEWII